MRDSLSFRCHQQDSGYHSNLSSRFNDVPDVFSQARDHETPLWNRDAFSRLHSSLIERDEDHPLVPSGSHDLTTRSFDSFIDKIKSIGKKKHKKKKKKKKEKQKDEPVDLEIGNHYANPTDKFARRSPPSLTSIEERGLKIGEGEPTTPVSQERGLDNYLTTTNSSAEKRGFKLDVLRKVAGGIAKNPKAAKVLTRIKSHRRLKHQHKPQENHWGDHPHHSIVNEPLPAKEAKPYESIWGAHPQSIFSRRFSMVDQEERGLVTTLLKKAKSVVKHKKKPDPIQSRPDAVPVDRKSPWQGVTKIQNPPPRPLKFGRTRSSLRQLFDEEDRKRGRLKSAIKKVMIVNLLRKKKKEAPDPVRSKPDAVPADPRNPWFGVTKIKNPAPRPLTFDPTMITPGRGRLAAIPEKRGLIKATGRS